MISLKIEIIALDTTKNLPFYSEIEHKTRSMPFFLKQEMPDIFSYYEYCGFYVHGILYTCSTKRHKWTSIYLREEIPNAQL